MANDSSESESGVELHRAPSQAAVERVTKVIESRTTSRRSFLVRAVGLSAAIAAAPIKFLLYPSNAFAVTPTSCGSGTTCHDSDYHTFCCTLSGGSNNCPSGTNLGGWWYANVGSGYCSQGPIRYYLDCLSTTCSCTCANNLCSNRKECCHGGYSSNCNQGRFSGNVFCRIVRCVNPCNISWPNGWTCSCSGGPLQATCCHKSGAANCTFDAPTCAACGGTP
jgi:hypothetical protein